MNLSARQGDGATLRQHLQRRAYSSGRVDPRLTPEPLPPAVRGLWATYLAMSACRRSGLGPSALALSDIEAWSRLQGVRLTPWEVDTIIALDAVALRVAAENAPKPQKD